MAVDVNMSTPFIGFGMLWVVGRCPARPGPGDVCLRNALCKRPGKPEIEFNLTRITGEDQPMLQQTKGRLNFRNCC